MIRYILFSGHMIDKAGRAQPRFPAAKEAAAAEAIHRTLKKVKAASAGTTLTSIAASAASASAGTTLIGIAAAACGGDILFHEACGQLQIPSEIYLGISIDAFRQTSVAFAGQAWVDRYRNLISRLPIHILHPNATGTAPDSIWEEANQWMLDTALSNGGDHLALIVLWDQAKGDGLGGTEHMVRVAQAHEATVEIIDVLSL